MSYNKEIKLIENRKNCEKFEVVDERFGYKYIAYEITNNNKKHRIESRELKESGTKMLSYYDSQQKKTLTLIFSSNDNLSIERNEITGEEWWYDEKTGKLEDFKVDDGTVIHNSTCCKVGKKLSEEKK